MGGRRFYGKTNKRLINEGFLSICLFYPETCAGTYLIDNVIEASAVAGIESQMTVPTPTRDVDSGMPWERTETLYQGMFKIHRFHMYGEGKIQ